uniref:patatin-like phospholipase domain-containing protein 7 isoform X1 n=1 Tax=Ciona intestinalis TaxID=7719 RepID=UPI00089DCEC4|nr:patatin-like phospholipase domain-containing protein 7 isoform X1 [Ciona intestinalis]|eukprot:XP_018672895.1 patatin-like phospholipase domain-containing protein 7 isoform X1 [Ciona intestinalis]
MTRMQRVTFLALHNYLGLSQELLRPTNRVSDDQLSIRKMSSSNILSELVERHSLSSADLKEQLAHKDDTPDAKHEEEVVSTTILPRSKSQPVVINNGGKVKQIRFNEIDTVVDDNDNVFHRQSSLPSDAKKQIDFKESVRQAQSRSIDAFMTPSPSEASCSCDSSSDVKIFELNEPEVLDLVTADLCQVFGIDDREMLQEHIALLKVCKGHQLINEGDQEVSIYFVVTGNLRVSQTLPEVGFDEQRNVTLFEAKPGMLTGQLAVLTGEPSFFEVSALVDSVIARVTRQSFYKMMRRYPRMVLNTAHTVMLRVSSFVRQIDFALDWQMVEAGKALYKQGSRSDCMYIILHGRLRSVHLKSDGKKELVAEYGKGEIVGMTEALKGISRPTSLHAVRDTELAKIPEGLIKQIRRQHPGVVTRLISLMSDKILGNMLSQKKSHVRSSDVLAPKQTMQEETSFAYGDVSNHLANLSTVAILPASSDVPLDKVSMELHHALGGICNQVLRLNSDLIIQRLGHNALDSVQEYRLSNWLAHHEDSHRMVLYQTDFTMTPWTQRCIRQADAVLIVALGDGEPKVGKLEAQLEGMAVRALKMLVLLHRPGIIRPTRTVDWLNMRGWLTEHIHIKCPKRLFGRTRKSKMVEYWEKLSTKPVDKFSDFSRLARFLTGTSIALVLGGGGARGLSQIGILQSLQNAGVPVDMIGGTSIGAFMGGLWAAHRNIETMKEKSLILCDDMSSIVSKILDLTYPFTSMFSGASFNRAIHTIFKDIQIEDLWIPYFTITTDITSSEMRVHTDGSLWRYIRGSMSYHPYLPPLCDPRDGHYLLDGCFVNNLPGDVARARGACKVIAVDVGSETEVDFTDYGDHLSGWWLLWKRWTGRWTGRIKVPDLNDIQSRLSYISCHYLLEKVIKSDYCFYVRPPIAKYKTLEFHKHKELYQVGFNHGVKIFTDEWASHFWKELISDQNLPVSQSIASKGRADISFTDLSEFLTEQMETNDLRNPSDSEYEFGYDSSPETFFRGSNGMRRMMSEPYDMNKMTEIRSIDQKQDTVQSLCAITSASPTTSHNYDRRHSSFQQTQTIIPSYSSDDEEDDSRLILSSSI